MGKRTVGTLAIGLVVGILIGWLVFADRSRFQELPHPGIDEGSDPVPPVSPTWELVDLRAILQQLPDDDLLNQFPNEAYLRLLGRVDTGEVLGTEEEQAEAGKLLREVLDHHEQLIGDPFYRACFQVSGNLAAHPILKNYYRASAHRAPWLVFAADGFGDEARRKPTLETIAARAATDLGRLYVKVVDLLGGQFDLPEISTLEQLHQRILTVIVFRRETDFDAYTAAVGIRKVPGTLAYYSDDDRLALAYGEFESPRDLSGLRYVAFQQLIHAFRKIVVERETGEEVIWEDRRLQCRLHWFNVGLASFCADGPEGGRQVADLKTVRERRLELWSFTELLSIRTDPELAGRARQKSYVSARELTGLFHAQAWAFVDFLMNFENGKYREKFMEYVGRELRGSSGPEEFQKVFWGREEPDWAAMEQEWQTHLDGMLAD